MKFTVFVNHVPRSGLPLLFEKVFLCASGLSSEAPVRRWVNHTAIGYTKQSKPLTRPNDIWAAVILAL